MALVDLYQNSMVRVATIYVQNQTLAEEVAQETWLRVLKGLERFEGRAAFKTWLFRILTNCAITYSKREGRTIPFSDLENPDFDADEPTVDPARFQPVGDPSAGHWVWPDRPRPWPTETLEDQLMRRELLAHIERAIESLPASQRAVITLHDVEGWASKDICNVLDISETNQRVLLHRARGKVRRQLEALLAES
jgi:RNA polymerase sigma-70 factor (ECF subfamily)